MGWDLTALDMQADGIKLIIVSIPDIASLIQGEALLDLGDWQ